jgi:hypothetical protein
MRKKIQRQRVRKLGRKAIAPRHRGSHSRKRQPRRSAFRVSGDGSSRLMAETAGQNAPHGQKLVFAEALVTPQDDGTFIVAPGKLRAQVPEVGSFRAAELLGVGYTALRAARESKLGRRYLRWRFTTETQRVLAWELPGLMAYKEATRSIGK